MGLLGNFREADKREDIQASYVRATCNHSHHLYESGVSIKIKNIYIFSLLDICRPFIHVKLRILPFSKVTFYFYLFSSRIS